jgi:arylsulfatase A-like enzyme
MRFSACLSACFLITIAGCQVPPTAPEHLVLVTLDTVRADRLGCYGKPSAGTTWLDSLAQRGTRFDHAYTPVPLTLPAHVSLLSGCYPSHTGIRLNGQEQRSQRRLLAEILRDSGFYTVAAVGGFPVTGRYATRAGFDVYDDRLRVGPSGEALERRAPEVVRSALDALRSRGSRRVFLWVHLYDAHDPYEPPPPFDQQFASDPYQGEIASLDGPLTTLATAVRGSLGPHVLYAVISDHGEGLGEHGEDTHGYFLYGATTRVPFLLSGADVPAGRVDSTPTSLVDFVPTALSLLRLKVGDAFDGRVIAFGDERSRPPMFLETLLPQAAYGFAPLFAGMDRGIKYIAAPRPELYELASDPGELRNALSDHPEDAARLATFIGATVGSAVVAQTMVDPRVASLGYVGPGGPGRSQLDPKDGLPIYRDFQSAERLLEAGRPADALFPLERLLGKADNAAVRFKRAQALRMLGRVPEASDELARLARAPDVPPPGFHLERARVAVALEEWALAERESLAHLQASPGSAVALLLHGASMEMLGDPAGAERDYRAALAGDPSYRDASLRLAALLVKSGRISEARAALLAHLRWHPEDQLARGLLQSI